MLTSCLSSFRSSLPCASFALKLNVPPSFVPKRLFSPHPEKYTFQDTKLEAEIAGEMDINYYQQYFVDSQKSTLVNSPFVKVLGQFVPTPWDESKLSPRGKQTVSSQGFRFTYAQRWGLPLIINGYHSHIVSTSDPGFIHTALLGIYEHINNKDSALPPRVILTVSDRFRRQVQQLLPSYLTKKTKFLWFDEEPEEESFVGRNLIIASPKVFSIAAREHQESFLDTTLRVALLSSADELHLRTVFHLIPNAQTVIMTTATSLGLQSLPWNANISPVQLITHFPKNFLHVHYCEGEGRKERLFTELFERIRSERDLDMSLFGCRTAVLRGMKEEEKFLEGERELNFWYPTLAPPHQKRIIILGNDLTGLLQMLRQRTDVDVCGAFLSSMKDSDRSRQIQQFMGPSSKPKVLLLSNLTRREWILELEGLADSVIFSEYTPSLLPTRLYEDIQFKTRVLTKQTGKASAHYLINKSLVHTVYPVIIFEHLFEDNRQKLSIELMNMKKTIEGLCYSIARPTETVKTAI